MSLRKGVWLRVGPGSSIPLKKSWYRVCVVTGMLTGVGSTWMCSHQLRWLGDAITWRWNSWLCGQWLVSRDLDVATLFSSEKSWDVSQGFLLVKFQTQSWLEWLGFLHFSPEFRLSHFQQRVNVTQQLFITEKVKSWYRVCVVTGMLTGVGSTWMCSHQLRWLGDAITWRWNSWLCGQWLVSRDLDVATLFSSEKSWDVSQGFLLVKFQLLVLFIRCNLLVWRFCTRSRSSGPPCG
ncbi:hypothetical protein G5714_004508 [Onychostoma macrolepis]|uniref:Uncharacterized protein n=1 Tax=Onychostoma macrolepis TaxID=369639 RepID=A0A7J6D5E2_9TELE|nr:hypothetical protein G5714_004508 [Onychostoma macrolepis]